MKRTSTKILSVVVALIMVFGLLPATVFAVGAPPDDAPVVHYSFNLNYGSGGIASQGNVNIGSDNVTSIADLVRTGYDFAGWFLTPACTGTATIAKGGGLTYTITEDTDFFAKWTAKNVTVTFLTGSTFVPNFVGKFDGLVTKPADPQMAGMTFAGWYSDAGLTIPWNFATDTIKTEAPLPLFAKFTGIGPGTQYTVNFVSNGMLYSQIAVVKDSKISAPVPEPVRAGYTFGGWLKAGATAWNFTTDTVGINPTTITAKWDAIDYHVTYEENGGTTVTDIKMNYAGDNAPTLAAALPGINKAGVIFGGWYYDAAFANKAIATDAITSDVTLYARWLNIYSVAYHLSDGSTNDILGFNQNVTEGSTVAAAAVAFPTRNGFVTPTKWYSDSACTTEFKFGGAGVGTAVAGNVNLYVKWVVDTNLIVNFDSQGGSAVSSIEVSPAGAKTVAKPANPTRAGYVFVNWTNAVGGAVFKFAGETGATVLSANITTLVANWVKTNAYRVTFIVDGAIYDAKDYTSGSAFTIPADPTKTGFTFLKWSAGAVDLKYAGDHLNSLPAAYTDRTVLGNLVWTAVFTQNNCTVTFSTTRGTAPTAQTKLYGAKADDPSTLAPSQQPSANGYLLDGWYTSPNGAGTKWNFATMTVSGSFTLYANWIAQYTVTLSTTPAILALLVASPAVVNDATVNWAASTTVTNGSKLLAPDFDSGTAGQQDPTLANYTFVGWFKDSLSGSQWTFGTNGDTVSANVTLYAKFVKSQISLTFYTNNGSAPIIKKVDFDATTLDVDNPTLSGFRFSGWDTNGDGAVNIPSVLGTTKTTINSIVLTGYNAIWQQNDLNGVVLTYRNGYDGATGIVSSTTVADGTILTSLPAIAYAGHTFGGWYTDSNGDGDIDAGELLVKLPLTITGPLPTNLVAAWTLNSYTVSFDPQGGTAVASVPANYGASIGKPADPTKPGYAFGGWYKEASCVNAWHFVGGAAPIDTVAGDTTLVAKWLTKYTISFVDNGSLIKQVLVVDGAKITVKGIADDQAPADPAPAGYTFNGWYTAASGGTLFLDDDLGAGVPSAAVTGNLVVYAQYTRNLVADKTVTFDSGIGGSYVASQSVAPGGKAVAPAAPLMAGNVFIQWNLGAAKYDFNTPVGGDITLVAVWMPDVSVQVYDLDDGLVGISYTAPYNSTINAPLAPATSNKFDWNGKWYTSALRTTEFNFTAPITGAITLYPGLSTGKLKIQFNGNGVADPVSQYLIAGSKVTKPSVTRVGYLLDGWYVINGGVIGSMWDFANNVTPATPLTLAAKWVYAYSITYNLNYTGSVAATSPAMYNRPLTAPADPARLGYIFQGWFVDAAAAGHQWDFSYDKLMKNTVLFAKWNPVVLTIGNYNKVLTNQSITVAASTNYGTLNATYHTFAANGSYTFIVKDAAGNTIASKVVTITNIDKVKPVISVKTSKAKVVANGATIKGVDLVVTATDANLLSKTVTLNGKAVVWPTTGKFTKHGTYIFTVKDKAGNVTTFKVILK